MSIALPIITKPLMKLSSKITLIFLITFLISCSSAKTYNSKMFGDDFLKNKTIVFTLNEKSATVGVVREGPSAGIQRQPDVKKAFKKSIENLAEETKLNLQYRDSFSQPNDSEIHIQANITQIKWIFTMMSATMKTNVNYDILEKDSQYESIGSFKNMSGGSEDNNLYKSLKNANYLFLKELEKNKEFN